MSIRPPDALQMAACLLNGAGAFVTNDHRLQRVQVGMEMLILDDYVE